MQSRLSARPWRLMFQRTDMRPELADIAPNFAAFPYIIRNDVNGLLFEPGNTHDLCAKLASMLGSAELLGRLRRGAEASGRRLVAEQTSFSKAVERAFALEQA